MCMGGKLYDNLQKNLQQNVVGFDFRGLSDAELQNARNVTSDQLKYMPADKQAQRAEELQKEIDRRDAPRRLAEERRALIAQQQAELVRQEKLFAEQQAAQGKQVQELQAQQVERLGGIRARGTAVTQSLQILASGGGQAPTAATSTPKSKAAGARSTTASLRMGSTGRGSGSGANVAV